MGFNSGFKGLMHWTRQH